MIGTQVVTRSEFEAELRKLRLSVSGTGITALPPTSMLVKITRTLIAGAGLTGGGDLSADRTFAVGAGTGIAVGADAVSLSHLGLEALTNPGADRIFFWDNSEVASKWLTCGDSIVITTATLDTIQDIRTSATPTFAGLYLKSSSAAPFLKLTNESDTERDPIIQYAVGASPVVKWTHGLDDSDGNKWKLAVGDEFGDDHDTIVVTSGEGSTPGVSEFTLIDTFAATSPAGICGHGAYLYYSDETTNQQLVKVDIITGAEITRSPDRGHSLYNCATDGTHAYVHDSADYTILKYLCADLSYVSASATWASFNQCNGICYYSGHLYIANLNAFNVRKIRCSDMATIWTTGFTQGSGTDQMNRPVGLTVDGQYIYVQDHWSSGGNNRIVRLNMDGTWVDSVVVANTLGGGNNESIAMWCAGDYLYNTAKYGATDYKIEKRNKSDLSISETFSVVPTKTMAGCQIGDYHYIVNGANQFIYKYQYTTSPAVATAGIQFRLKDAYGQFVDIAKLTAGVRLGVGTTIPSETIEAVGNIKATAGQLISTMATGTAPVVVSSTTLCTNLNAGLVDGYHHDQSLLTTASPTFAVLSLSATSNQIILQSAGVTGTITATPATSNKVWTLQNVTGTIYQTGGTDVAVADGGTNKSSWTLYALPYASGTTTIGEIAIGSAGQVLAVNVGADGYTWAAALSNPMNAVGDIIVGGVAGAPAKLAAVAVGSYLASGGVTTAPAWAALNQAAFVAGVDLSTTGGPTFDHLHLTTDLPVSEGGTGASTFTLNGILYGNAANPIGVTAAGDDTKYLTATSGGVPTWDILNQGQVAGLTTADGPTFDHVHLTTTSYCGGNLIFSGAATRNISHSVDDQAIFVNAGSAYNKGASLQFYGEDQASFPGDAYIVAGSSDRATLGSIIELAFRDAGTYRKLLTLTYAATPVALVTGSLQCTTGFGCNSKTAQTAYVVGAAAPAGGTGATAGAYDTAVNRNAMITLLNNIRLALLANGIAVNA